MLLGAAGVWVKVGWGSEFGTALLLETGRRFPSGYEFRGEGGLECIEEKSVDDRRQLVTGDKERF